MEHTGPDEEHMMKTATILLIGISLANSSLYTTCFPCTPRGHCNMCWLAFPVGIRSD